MSVKSDDSERTPTLSTDLKASRRSIPPEGYFCTNVLHEKEIGIAGTAQDAISRETSM